MISVDSYGWFLPVNTNYMIQIEIIHIIFMHRFSYELYQRFRKIIFCIIIHEKNFVNQ